MELMFVNSLVDSEVKPWDVYLDVVMELKKSVELKSEMS